MDFSKAVQGLDSWVDEVQGSDDPVSKLTGGAVDLVKEPRFGMVPVWEGHALDPCQLFI